MRLSVLFVLCLFFNIQTAYSSFFIQHSFFYNTDEDDAENFSYSRMNNLLFLGASIGKKNKFFLGQSIHLSNKSHQATSGSTESTISVTELGPRIIYFLNQERTWAFSFTYNPYAKGSRKLNGVDEDISGSSMIVSFAYQLKISKSLYMGASVNYYTYSLSNKTVDNTETDVSHSYTTIMPMLDFSLRFR